MCDPEGCIVERFSRSQIIRAGKLIVGAHSEPTEELIDAYRTTHAWRDAHVTPMRRVRASLTAQAKRLDAEAVTAGRLKRLQSMRRKLKPGGTDLYDIQDIAGCRAILPTIAQVRELTQHYAEHAEPHQVLRRNDYINVPKLDGYRSNHLVLKFYGPEDITGGNRLKVELQIRTRLQHAWATAVEAVGLILNQNLKAGQGSPEWLRLFQLMAAEAADEEDCAGIPSAGGSQGERRRELREIAKSLDAVRHLEGYNEAIQYGEAFTSPRGTSFIIRYDLETRTVSVRPFSQFAKATLQYNNQDMIADSTNSVLVEVDRVEELAAAYPNYFLDVRMFTDRLRRAVYDRARPNSRFGNLEWLRDFKRPTRPPTED